MPSTSTATRTRKPCRSMAPLAGLLSLGLSACGGAGMSPEALKLPDVKAPQIALPAVKMPDVKLPDVKVPKIEMPKMVGPAVGTPTEVYTRIARGALLCWFGGNGPLKGKYIYHANAEPPSRGGKAEIAIHTIDPTAANPRAGKVFRIDIVPEAGGERAVVSADNSRLPDELARRMWYDTHRWAGSPDEVQCLDADTAEGWGAGAEPGGAESAKASPKKRPVKPAAPAAQPAATKAAL